MERFTILDQLADYARFRVQEAEKRLPLKQLMERAERLPVGSKSFEKALRKSSELSFICELKKASPSKGIISEDFPYRQIAKSYETGGADCISCLTEPKWFLGSDDIFKEVRQLTALPMLRKDFTVSEYQIYEAKCMGADAVLLICALLDDHTLERFLLLATRLGLTALAETHTAEEIDRAVSAGAAVIGINNRNLKSFSVDLETTASLRALIPKNALFVAESGIQTPKDAAYMKEMGADALLIGEALMKAADPAARLAEFKETVS